MLPFHFEQHGCIRLHTHGISPHAIHRVVQVFDEKRSLFFKSIKVRRIVDKETKNVVYVAYSAKFNPKDDSNKSRFKSSLCALHYD